MVGIWIAYRGDIFVLSKASNRLKRQYVSYSKDTGCIFLGVNEGKSRSCPNTAIYQSLKEITN